MSFIEQDASTLTQLFNLRIDDSSHKIVENTKYAKSICYNLKQEIENLENYSDPDKLEELLKTLNNQDLKIIEGFQDFHAKLSEINYDGQNIFELADDGWALEDFLGTDQGKEAINNILSIAKEANNLLIETEKNYTNYLKEKVDKLQVAPKAKKKPKVKSMSAEMQSAAAALSEGLSRRSVTPPPAPEEGKAKPKVKSMSAEMRSAAAALSEGLSKSSVTPPPAPREELASSVISGTPLSAASNATLEISEQDFKYPFLTSLLNNIKKQTKSSKGALAEALASRREAITGAVDESEKLLNSKNAPAVKAAIEKSLDEIDRKLELSSDDVEELSAIKNLFEYIVDERINDDEIERDFDEEGFSLNLPRIINISSNKTELVQKFKDALLEMSNHEESRLLLQDAELKFKENTKRISTVKVNKLESLLSKQLVRSGAATSKEAKRRAPPIPTHLTKEGSGRLPGAVPPAVVHEPETILETIERSSAVASRIAELRSASPEPDIQSAELSSIYHIDEHDPEILGFYNLRQKLEYLSQESDSSAKNLLNNYIERAGIIEATDLRFEDLEEIYSIRNKEYSEFKSNIESEGLEKEPENIEVLRLKKQQCDAIENIISNINADYIQEVKLNSVNQAAELGVEIENIERKGLIKAINDKNNSLDRGESRSTDNKKRELSVLEERTSEKNRQIKTGYGTVFEKFYSRMGAIKGDVKKLVKATIEMCKLKNIGVKKKISNKPPASAKRKDSGRAR